MYALIALVGAFFTRLISKYFSSLWLAPSSSFSPPLSPSLSSQHLQSSDTFRILTSFPSTYTSRVLIRSKFWPLSRVLISSDSDPPPRHHPEFWQVRILSTSTPLPSPSSSHSKLHLLHLLPPTTYTSLRVSNTESINKNKRENILLTFML